jgi:hypothetical protein
VQETHGLAKTQLQNAKSKSKLRYDSKLAPLNIKIDDKVMLEEKANKGKLAPKWNGPYTVIELSPDSPNITILKKNKPVVLHRNLLKLFHERNTFVPESS